MCEQTPISFANLTLRWGEPGYWDGRHNPYSDFVEMIPLPSRIDFKKLSFALTGPETALLGSLHAFTNLKCLTLNLYDMRCVYVLQAILERLCTPSVQFLKVQGIEDWRVRWQASFNYNLASLRGLLVEVGCEDDVMLDNADSSDSDTLDRPPPSNVMWETVLTFYQHSTFVDISYDDDAKPFLNYAPSYADSHHLDPVPLIQWLVKSIQFVYEIQDSDSLFMTLGPVPRVTDLTKILQAIQPLDLGSVFPFFLHLELPHVITPSIANLLHHNIDTLNIVPASHATMDPFIVTAWIRLLPKLTNLNFDLKMSKDFSTPYNRCTAATYSLSTFGEATAIFLNVSRSDGPDGQERAF